MKRRIFICLLLVFSLSSLADYSWAIDVGWMQEGVRVWYLGAASTGFSSDSEEAYLFTSISDNTAQLTHHSGLNHWVSTNPTETEYGSILDQGPCWIHPQVLQTIASGNTWQGQVISTILKGAYTYDTFLNEVSPSGVIPYLLLPIKVLFDLNPQRNLVKIVYYDPDLTSTGMAYFDTDTGLLLLRENSTGYVTIFFILSEINYNFANKIAFAEDNGPHTGFQSTAYEYTSLINFVQIVSSVETRYGSTVQMWVTSQAGGSGASYVRPNENYCFFGSESVLKRKEMTITPNYPPENWNAYGEYLWWWVPAEALADTTINIFNVSMARTLTSPYTFEATEAGSSLYFSKIIFDNDGYMTSFYAKDPTINLDLSMGTLYPNNNIAGLTYYKNTMGTAIPDPDRDHDGMPDEWEVEYFGDTTRDGTGDYDGDGYSNLQEYQGRSDPTDPNSHPLKAMPWIPLLLLDD